MRPLTIFLTQHTPLIHFQHDQTGATLRATEVKAKADYFFYHELKDGWPELYQRFEKVIESGFRKGETGYSGKYKLRIQGKVQERYVFAATGGKKFREKMGALPNVSLEEYSSYFADAPQLNDQKTIRKMRSGNYEDIRLGVMFENIVAHIFTFDQQLRTFLEVAFPLFFTTKNFGTRQTKGFGCFTTASMSRSKFEKALLKDPKNLVVYWKTSKPNSSAANKLQTITKDYKLLKSGNNPPGNNSPDKSELWYYLCAVEKGKEPLINWEKRHIKEILSEDYPEIWEKVYRDYQLPETDGRSNRDGLPAFYIRALLGLAEQIEFRTTNKQYEVSIRINDEDGEVTRSASPIIFKVFKDRIYLIARAPDKHLWLRTVKNKENETTYEVRRKFSFKLNTKGFESNYRDELLFSLEVPSDFNIANFLKEGLSQASPVKGYRKLKNV